MTDANQYEPERRGLLNEQRVKTAEDFNSEMNYLSWPYRMVQSLYAGERMVELHAGDWVLEDPSIGCVHIAPTPDETMAVHIMRAWIYGVMHEQGNEIGRKFLRGELADDNANPY